MPKKSFKKKEAKEVKEKTPILEKVVLPIHGIATRSGTTELRLVTWSLDGKPLLEKRDKIKTKSGHLVNGRKPRGLGVQDFWNILEKLPEIIRAYGLSESKVADLLAIHIRTLNSPAPESAGEYV